MIDVVPGHLHSNRSQVILYFESEAGRQIIELTTYLDGILVSPGDADCTAGVLYLHHTVCVHRTLLVHAVPGLHGSRQRGQQQQHQPC